MSAASTAVAAGLAWPSARGPSAAPIFEIRPRVSRRQWTRESGQFSSGDGCAASGTSLDASRAVMNIAPASDVVTPGVLKAVVRANRNDAGVHEWVVRIGRPAVGQEVHVRP